MAIVALITDLFFVSKVKGTADALGVALVVVRGIEGLSTGIRNGAEMVIVDLNASGVDVIEAIRTCRAEGSSLRIISYLSHVQKELAEAAKAAGADLVLPRSKFSQELPSILRGA